MDVKSAAIQVLQQAGTALHASDIAEQIMDAGLWQSEGKTSNATVSARLYSDIKNNGDKSAFEKVGPQTFALRDTTARSNFSKEDGDFSEPLVETPKLYPARTASHSRIVPKRCLRSTVTRSPCTTRRSPKKRMGFRGSTLQSAGLRQVFAVQRRAIGAGGRRDHQ